MASVIRFHETKQRKALEAELERLLYHVDYLRLQQRAVESRIGQIEQTLGRKAPAKLD